MPCILPTLSFEKFIICCSYSGFVFLAYARDALNFEVITGFIYYSISSENSDVTILLIAFRIYIFALVNLHDDLISCYRISNFELLKHQCMVPTKIDEQFADIFTKGLNKTKFEKF